MRLLKNTFSVVCSLCLLTSLGCGANKQARKKTVIGSVMQQSATAAGGGGGGGSLFSQGIDLAVDEVNAAGGVLDTDLSVDAKDSLGEPNTAVKVAKELIDAKVPVILGEATSGQYRAVAEGATIAAGVVLISGSATNPSLTDLADNDFCFRTAASDKLQGPALADLIYGDGHRNVAIFVSDDYYGAGLKDVFKPAFLAKPGTSIVIEETFVDDATLDMTAHVNNVLGANPDAVVFTALNGAGAKVLKDWYDAKGSISRPTYLGDAFKNSDTAGQSGGAQVIKGIKGTAPAADFSSAAYQKFKSAWQKKYAGDSPDTDAYASTYYDAAMVVALAIQKAGKTDATAIRDALRSVANPPGEVVGPGDFKKALELIKAGTDINYEGASGSVDFDAKGDVPGKIEIWHFDDNGTPQHDSFVNVTR